MGIKIPLASLFGVLTGHVIWVKSHQAIKAEKVILCYRISAWTRDSTKHQAQAQEEQQGQMLSLQEQEKKRTGFSSNLQMIIIYNKYWTSLWELKW